MTLWTQRIRHSLRALRARPLHTGLVVLTFALGIGLNTPLVATAARLFTAPLPYAEADRLVVPWPGNAIPSALLGELHESSPSFDGMAITWDVLTAEYHDPTDPAGRVVGYRVRQVSRNFFDLVGLRPALGRAFVDADVPPRELWAAPTKVMLTWDAWVDLFGADPSVVGVSVDRGSHTTEIVGVMPPEATPLARGSDGWSVVAFVSDVVGQPQWRMEALARLAPGIPIEQARSELEGRLARAQATSDVPVIAQWSPRPVFGPSSSRLSDETLVPLRLDLAGNTRSGMVLLVAAGLATLLVALVNASALGLHRSVGRRREAAIRRAIGADRRDLVGLVLTEQSLLALAGGGAAVALAWSGVRGLRWVLPDELPYGLMGAMTGDLLGWALVTSLLCGLLSTAVAVIPVLAADGSSAGPDGAEGGDRRHTPARRSLRGLLAVQVALITVLMVGAGVLLRTVHALGEVDTGFESERVAVLTPQAAGLVARTPDAPAATVLEEYFDQVVGELEALPFVSAVGTGPTPFSFPTEFRWEVTEGTRPIDPGRPDVRAILALVGPGDLFEALGVDLLQGRRLRPEDATPADGESQAVVVNEVFSRTLWGGEDPLGRTFRVLGGGGDPLTFRVEGVVAPFRFFALDREPEPQIWMRFDPRRLASVPIHVRLEGDPTARLQRLEAAFRAVDPRVPLVGARALDDLVAESIRNRTAALRILLALAGLGLALALLGIYGVASLNTSSRLREIGIRRALGARAGAVLAAVLGGDAAWVLAGIGAGLAAALATAPLLEAMLYGVSPADPVTLVAVPATLLVTAAVAAAGPALRALRLDPSRTLRGE